MLFMTVRLKRFMMIYLINNSIYGSEISAQILLMLHQEFVTSLISEKKDKKNNFITDPKKNY